VGIFIPYIHINCKYEILSSIKLFTFGIMKAFKYYILIIIFSFCLSANGYTQATLSDNSKISLLTIGPGTQIADMYGHTAIRIKDLSQNKDEIYHYGLYDFETPNFVMKFLRGKLMYQMGASNIKQFTAYYDRAQRTMYEQTLNLDSQQKNIFYAALRENFKPKNRKYLYDFFFENCATIVGDRIETLIGEIQYPKDRESKTFRQMIDEHQQEKPWTDFGIDLVIGSIADETTTINEQLFLPLYVHDILKDSYIKGKPLVTDEKLLLDYIAKENKKPGFTPMHLFILLLVLELMLLGGFFNNRLKIKRPVKIYDQFWFLLFGIGSLILTFMWFGTDHLATKDNWNLFWMNPLYLVLFFALWKTKTKMMHIVLVALIIFNLLTLVKLPAQFQEIHFASYFLVIVSTLKLLRHILKK